MLALGEWEVPLFREVSTRLPASVSVDLRCYLPRTAEPGIPSVSDTPAEDADMEEFGIMALSATPDIGYVAHYDRDWKHASWKHKAAHGRRTGARLLRIIRASGAEAVVSSVGGETARVALEIAASSLGVQRIYFNSIPLPDRHVVLPALSAPLVPWSEDRPIGQASQVEQDLGKLLVSGESRPLPALPGLADTRHELASGTLVEGLVRARQIRQFKGTYPPLWLLRKALSTMLFDLRRRLPAPGSGPSAGNGASRLLYPLHDEDDFQIAVRERHALPQSGLVDYVSSVLPSSWQLVVRIHPAHRGAVPLHTLRHMAALPNVRIDDASEPIGQALARSSAVLTLASTVGFDALLAGRPVICFGRPFYGRRGVTTDISDVRQLPEALRTCQPPPRIALTDFVAFCYAQSFPGRFGQSSDPDLLAASLVDKLEPAP